GGGPKPLWGLFGRDQHGPGQPVGVCHERRPGRLGGGLLSPMYLAHPMVGMLPATKSFVIVVLGGMGSVAGSLVGGLIMGVLEAFGAVYISYQYQDVFGFILLILVLMLRPWGLFGERAREL